MLRRTRAVFPRENRFDLLVPNEYRKYTRDQGERAESETGGAFWLTSGDTLDG